MPRARRIELSLAPGSICGTTGTPGHSSALTFSRGPITSGRNGDGLVASDPAPRETIGVTEIFGSLSTSTRALIVSSDVWPGRIRQLTLAVATPGSAFLAWPAWSTVATEVVRKAAW